MHPKKKAIVTAAAMGGAVGVVVTFAVGAAITVPGEVGVAIGTICTGLLSLVWPE